ncbi:MAG: acyl-CoA dehydrogenase family protein [Streptosporangiaceae bacterium]
MDFSEVDRLAEYRQGARDWVAAHVDPRWAEQQRSSGSYHTPELHSLLAEQGWLGAGWAASYGGTDNDPDMAAALLQEIDAAGLHMDGWATTKMISNTLLHTATEEQKREVIGGALRGEVLIVLGYTEPDSGSDVAAAKTRSERDGDEWLVNGQKMFTSTAHRATPRLHAHPQQHRGAQAQGPDHVPGPAGQPRRGGPADLHARRPADERHLLHRRAGPRLGADRPG